MLLGAAGADQGLTSCESFALPGQAASSARETSTSSASGQQVLGVFWGKVPAYCRVRAHLSAGGASSEDHTCPIAPHLSVFPINPTFYGAKRCYWYEMLSPLAEQGSNVVGCSQMMMYQVSAGKHVVRRVLPAVPGPLGVTFCVVNGTAAGCRAPRNSRGVSTSQVSLTLSHNSLANVTERLLIGGLH